MLKNKLLSAMGGAPANYIEECFSTWLIKPSADFTTYSINNGIDLSTKGGMTWFKARDAAQNNLVYDTARGSSSGSPNALITNSSSVQQTAYFDYVTPNTNGFTVNYASGGGQLTNSGINYASWTFRKQPKFFDVVTWTGNDANRTIAHNLGSVPGCIIVKRLDGTASDWNVYHQSIGNTFRLLLNSTAQAYDIGDACWNATTPTSTVFSLGTNSGVNASGATYVAYLFAHNAGGFGLTGTDNVISCGSYVGSGVASPPKVVTLGYEPQWIMIKSTTNAYDWVITDTMRGMSQTSGTYLVPNTSAAEVVQNPTVTPTATGFELNNSHPYFNSNDTYIYIAIRRGPMKVPTDGTKVFAPVARAGTGATATVTAGFTPDLVDILVRQAGAKTFIDRLRGRSVSLNSTSTGAETTSSRADYDLVSFNMNGITLGPNWNIDVNDAAQTYVNHFFARAPGFFDEVCYTGNGTFSSRPHNLQVVPELSITKARGATGDWIVYTPTLQLRLNTTAAATSNPYGSVGTPTTFNPAWDSPSVANVAYLFATCPGVSKVFSYTGNGSSQTINCGFTSGARFVLIKRTDSTGDWYVWDSARGIVSGNDPHLSLNTTAAEVTTDDSVDADSTGFIVNQVAATDINVSSATYVGIAIS